MEIFRDKVAIVTGGASGIGKGLGEALVKRGARVILADINGQLLEETASAQEAAGGKVKPVKLDVTDHPAVKALVDQTVAEHGRLDYIFNNAGIGVFGEARDYSYDDWQKVINVNLFGVVNGVAAAYPVMVRQGFGHIVNTASLAGLVPASFLVAYTTSKHGVVGLSHALRIEGADLGVKVSVVCPGFIKTPIYYSPTLKLNQEKLLAGAPQGLAPEKCAQVILKGVERNQATILVTALAKIAYPLYRLCPGLIRWLGQQIIKKARRNFRVEDH